MTGVIAHRGYSKKFPENTMLAFKEAAKYDIDGIELDVQMTKDGQVVICHDEKIDRTSDGTGLIKDLTLAELKTYNFGIKFDNELSDDTTIPTLDEFLEWFSENNFLVNIELKTNIFRYKGMIDKILNLIEKYQVADRVIISSFQHHSVREVKEKNSEVQTGLLTMSGLLKPGEYTKDGGFHHYHPHFISLEAEDIANCLNNNIGINTYTVNDAEYMSKLAEDSVTNIITDDVELAISTVKI